MELNDAQSRNENQVIKSGIFIKEEICFENTDTAQDPKEIIPNNNQENFKDNVSGPESSDDCSDKVKDETYKPTRSRVLKRKIGVKRKKNLKRLLKKNTKKLVSENKNEDDISTLESLSSREPDGAEPRGIINHRVLCPICDKSIAPQSINKHIQGIHKERRKYPCPKCSQIFYSEQWRSNHVERLHPEGERVESSPLNTFEDTLGIPVATSGKISASTLVQCPFCDKVMIQRCLDFHRKTYHDEQKTAKCPKCFKAFADQEEVETHMTRTHDKPPVINLCSHCREPVPLKAMKRHIKKFHTEKKKRIRTVVFCPHCKKQVRKQDLKGHINNIHQHLQDYTCKLCSEVFPKESTLRTHKRHAHGLGIPAKKHVCQICGASFAHPGAFRQHVAIVHEKKRDHLCDVCGQSFQTASAMVVHKRGHSGHRPYRCKICSKSFTRSYQCKKHIQRVHHLDVQGRMNSPFTAHLVPIQVDRTNENDSRMTITEGGNQITEKSHDDPNVTSEPPTSEPRVSVPGNKQQNDISLDARTTVHPTMYSTDQLGQSTIIHHSSQFPTHSTSVMFQSGQMQKW